MIESATFHVMTTELVVGSFALAGLCFFLHSVFLFLNKERTFMPMMDTTAHVALLFGLLALPFAILSGIESSPSGAHTSPLLANKMLLSTAGGGSLSAFCTHAGRIETLVLNTSTMHLARSQQHACFSRLHLVEPIRGRFFDRILAICEGEHTPASIVVEHRCDCLDSGGLVVRQSSTVQHR